MRRTPTTGDTIVEVYEDIPCFLPELEGFEENLEHEASVSIDTRGIDSMLQIELAAGLMPSGIARDELMG